MLCSASGAISSSMMSEISFESWLSFYESLTSAFISKISESPSSYDDGANEILDDFFGLEACSTSS